FLPIIGKLLSGLL
nr:RecName: Full=Temporin-1CSb [Rana cascadae]P17232.1 RecName: Full=Vespid chemotactic peptide M; Short=VESCP-M; Short=Ves-CP-M [Vespa mandarinia]